METWMQKAQKVEKILARAPKFDKNLRVEESEFRARQQALIAKIAEAGIDCALVYSDEHYCGDVPYLGGCVNISIEPIAGVLGKNGFHILAGLEGGYVAEQLSPRAGCGIHKVEMLKLADEEYPIDAERIEDVLVEACGQMPRNVGLFTPRAVLPVGVYEYFASLVGEENMIDCQEIYYKQKYIKSDREMELTRQAARMCDVMLEGMLAVLEPGMLETEVASWGYLIGRQIGAESFGFDVMVTSGEANRTLIGKALNRVIQEGDYVHLGVAPKCDGLTACERCTVVATLDPARISEDQKYWIRFVEGAYQVGLDAYRRVSAENLPAKLQEQALCDYFKAHEEEVCARLGKKIDFVRQKPYTGTHNGGYTECQEFYGAITLNSEEPLGSQIITMLDVAVRGVGNKWNEVVIPGMDYVLVEKTLGKYGTRVDVLNELPINLQAYVGRVVE
ncbi:MAG TPA: M24 family metallopeptidase [Candidatus Pullichristensenella avicola]|nr:M24 family metallopeptidase [Candidatus Pullichristensenella avicola]